MKTVAKSLVAYWRRRRSADEPVRRWVRRALFVFAVALFVPMIRPGSAVGQAHVDRGGSVGIQNDTERELFFSLICMCGCPRETLGTCSCDYANARRGELRDLLGEGKSVQAIQKAYSARFGTQSLAVPTNEGLGLLIWAFPLVAFIVMAFVVVRLLRRWTGRGVAAAKVADAKPVATGRDEYDDRLDTELKDLDRE
jgi:cytochrome c-type biogenesis protein CcmH